MPMRIPSTTSRAISSREPIFWRVTGSRYFSRNGSLRAGCVEALISRGRFQQFLDDVVRRLALGASREVGDDTMPQYRPGHRLNVLDRDVEPSVQDGPRLAGHDQEQARPRASPVGQPVLDELRGVTLARPS